MAVFMGAAFSPLGAVMCLLTSLILYLVYRLLYAPYHVHKQYGIKGPIPEPFWGSYSEIKKMKLNNFLEEGQKKYGSFFGFYIGSKFNVVVCDRKLIKQIMIDHGDNLHCGGPCTVWNQMVLEALKVPSGLQVASGHRRKSVVTPVLSAVNIRQMVPIINNECTQLVQKIAEAAKSEESINVHKLYMTFAMETIMTTTFGEEGDVKTGGKSSQLATATTEFITAFLDSKNSIGLEDITVILSHFSLLKPLVAHLAGRLTPSKAQLRLQETGPRLVEARRTHTSSPQDLLQVLLDTKPEMENGNSQTISDEQALTCAVEFLISGYGTTASVLSYVSYMLALHAEIQQRVQAEIDKCFKKKPDKPLYEASLLLPYLDSVIKETMRLYPPMAILCRHCDADIVLEKHTLPKGAEVYIPIFLVHRNPESWPQPYMFNPQRFSNDKTQQPMRAAYLPFSTDSQNGIGMKFALAEIKMALVAILRHYSFVRSPNTEVPLQIEHGLVGTPKNGVLLHILPR